MPGSAWISKNDSTRSQPETVTRYRRILVSFDASERRHYAAARIAQRLFGRVVKIVAKSGVKTYRYEGLTGKCGVERIGQSVLLMPEKEAEDFHRFLMELRVPHTRQVVWTE